MDAASYLLIFVDFECVVNLCIIYDVATFMIAGDVNVLWGHFTIATHKRMLKERGLQSQIVGVHRCEKFD